MGMSIDPFRPDRHGVHPALTLSAGLSSGFPLLDRLLPGGGWPTGAVTEILARRGHVDPAGLLLPALAPLSWEGRWVAWIGEPPPPRPLLEAHGFDSSRVLAVRPRAADNPLELVEQALVADHCGAILVWPACLERFAVSRLQQIARGGDTAVFLFCPPGATAQPLAGELRVYVSTHSRRLAVEILACRGGAGSVLQLAHDESPPPARCPRRLPWATTKNNEEPGTYRQLTGSSG